MLRYSAGVSALALGLLFAVPGAQASSLAVSPLTIEAKADPGRSYTGVIKVMNPGDGRDAAGVVVGETLRVRVRPGDWALSLSGTPIYGKPGVFAGSCSRAVRVNPAEFTLAPGETKIVRYTVSLPPKQRGEFRTVIFFEADPRPVRVGEQHVGLITRIGAIIYIDTTTAPERAVGFTDLRLFPDRVEFELENTGNVHVRGTGEVQIRQGDRLVHTLQISGFVVLPAPYHRRRITVPLEHNPGLPAGTYTVTAVVDYGADKLMGARRTVRIQ